MTRWVQHPADKTKMEETIAWAKESGIADKIRSAKGVRDVEISFCPGEGWVGARYISDDLDDMRRADTWSPPQTRQSTRKGLRSSPHIPTP
jgi:hypothetical protein